MPRRALILVLCCAVSSVAAAPAAPRSDEAARLARRDRHRAILTALWGSASTQPAGLAEFGLHAWRMARLRRMERLAAELARPVLLERIGGLLAKEQARHLKHMKRLQDSTAPAAAASAESSPKPPPAQRGRARKD